MKKVWRQFQLFIPAAGVVLLLSLPCPSAFAHNGTPTSQTAPTSQQAQATEEQEASAKATSAKPKKPASKTRDKSVLDADVLDSPLSYFKEAFSPEDESNNSSSPTVVNTVKALVATLLSTVL